MAVRFKANYYTDYNGRRRKLPAEVIRKIMREFVEGDSPTLLASRYGVSKSLIYTITWHLRNRK